MKFAAAILFFIASFLTIQPLIKIAPKNIAMRCCTEKACKKKKPEQNKKNPCEGMACNPFVGCPYYCLFLVTAPSLSPLQPQAKEKIGINNDNRTIQSISECWHPPNA